MKHRPRVRTSRVLLAATTFATSTLLVSCDDLGGTNPKPPDCADPNLGSAASQCRDMTMPISSPDDLKPPKD